MDNLIITKKKINNKNIKNKRRNTSYNLEHKTYDFVTEYSHGVPPTKLISESGI